MSTKSEDLGTDGLVPGRRFKSWELDEYLQPAANGHFARVRNASSKASAVLLALGDTQRKNSERRRSFVAAMQVLERLQPDRDVGTFVPRILDRAPDGHWVVLDVGPYTTLGAEAGALNDKTKRQVMNRLLSGVGKVHERGVILRSLDMYSVAVVLPGRKVVMLDWTLAVDGESGDALAAGRRGPPLFAAPEQLDGKPHGAPADVYALCRMIDSMAAGSARPVNGAVRDLAGCGMRRSLYRAVVAGTASEPARRPPDANALRREIYTRGRWTDWAHALRWPSLSKDVLRQVVRPVALLLVGAALRQCAGLVEGMKNVDAPGSEALKGPGIAQ